MNYDEFIKSRDILLEYAQNAINIYDEIYESLPEKFKKVGYGFAIKDVKSLYSKKNPYCVDCEEAIFGDDGILFIEERPRGDDVVQNKIEIPRAWIIADKDKQRERINRSIERHCEKVRDKIDKLEERERKKQEEKDLEKERRLRAQYEELKKKFEN